jgi:nucleoid-associated protein YgaU
MTAALDLDYRDPATDLPAGSAVPGAVSWALPEFSAAAAPARLTPVPDRPQRRDDDDEQSALAPVIVLCPPAETRSAAPIRLTRRGVVVLTGAVATVGGALVWLASLSSPAATPALPAAGAGQAVTVSSGDTLWSIAARVAPTRDPRSEVSALQRANHLDGSELVPGQVLRVP